MQRALCKGLDIWMVTMQRSPARIAQTAGTAPTAIRLLQRLWKLRLVWHFTQGFSQLRPHLPRGWKLHTSTKTTTAGSYGAPLADTGLLLTWGGVCLAQLTPGGKTGYLHHRFRIFSSRLGSLRVGYQISIASVSQALTPDWTFSSDKNGLGGKLWE